MKESSSTLFSRRFLALLLLGISSGLPLALSGDLLSAWLTDAGFDTRKIGSIGLVGLPYACKVIWSPLADRFSLPFLGRRRGWMAATQILLIGAIAVLAHCDPKTSLPLLALAATAVAFLSASQDIVIDAWRADVLEPSERGPGAAVSVCGYRVGMIASGAGGLILVGRFHLSWQTACQWTAAGMGVGLLGTFLASEGKQVVAGALGAMRSHRPTSLKQAVVDPLRDLLLRRNGWVILLFVLVFKLPESIANAMSIPFLLQIKFRPDQIGAVRQGLGVALTILGTLAGGGIVRRFGVWKSLWLFGILHSVSNLAFVAMAESGPSYGMLVAVIAVENVCIGLTTAGFTAWMIGQCDARFSAFQFALLSGIMALGRQLAGPLSGQMAHALPWPAFFGASALLGIPGLLLLPWIGPEEPLHLPLVVEETLSA
jgi:MFS transporter, PAT family, beta-lactamase induction signal transducer AmpG